MRKLQLLISLLVVASIMAFFLPLFDMVYLYPSATSLVNDKIRQDVESLGQFLATDLQLDNQPQRLQERLLEIKQAFQFVSVSVRAPDGRILHATDQQFTARQQPSFPGALENGISRSRFLLNSINSTEPGSLLEIQTPLMVAGELQAVLEIIHDAAGLQNRLEKTVSRASLFLLAVVVVFFTVILLIARMARRVVQQQQQSDEELAENRRQLQQKHKELNQLFALVEQAKYEWQLTLDCISDMILLVEESGKVRRCNEALIRFVGRSYLDVLGKDWGKVLFAQAVEMISVNRQHSEIYHPEKKVWLYMEFYPYTDEQGEKLTVIRIQQQAQTEREDQQGSWVE